MVNLYVNVNLRRKSAIIMIDIDLTKDVCHMYLREDCPICNGTGCTPECRKQYPDAEPADVDGQVITRITGDNVRDLLGDETLTLVQKLLSDNIMTR